eukprot:gb/GECG01006913.1/.p1 GENE.gb/GECG01006913.1/~~gb/GECG01006913.1/.p1  ORF type:complete len:121 (+),score=10.60 gb/GECG01006913.1/:1-363(+)
MNMRPSHRVAIPRSTIGGVRGGLTEAPFRAFSEASSAPEDEASGGKHGNTFRYTYERMLQECPMAVCAYGACIQRNLRSLQKDVCQQQFLELKKCMQVVRQSSVHNIRTGSTRTHSGNKK